MTDSNNRLLSHRSIRPFINHHLKPMDWRDIPIQLAKMGLGGAIIFSPFRYSLLLRENSITPIYRVYTDISVFLPELFVLAIMLLWALSFAIRPRRLRFSPLYLTIPLAGLVISGFLSAVGSTSPVLSTYLALRLLELFALYLFVMNEIKSLSQILWAISASVFLQASVGILQVIQQRSVGLAFLGEHVLDTGSSSVTIVWAQGLRSLRAYGLSDHPNILGGSLAFMLLLIIAGYMAVRSSKKPLLVSVYVLGVLALFYTFSFISWTAFIVGILVVVGMILVTRNYQVFFREFYLVLAGILFIIPFVWSNFAYLTRQPNSYSQQEARALNAAANKIFSENAITGVGLGTFPIALKHFEPDFPFYYQPAHVVLLNSAAEIGIFGALFYFLALVIPWLGIWFNRTQLDFSPALIGSSGALAAIILISFFDYYPWTLAAGQFWQWLIWGLWAAFYQVSLTKVGEDV